jgi:23S rRNA pseudouridine1911/1915/1917 synthase
MPVINPVEPGKVESLKRDYCFTDNQPQRLDIFLTQHMPEVSRSQIQRLVKNGCVLVNDELPRKSGTMLENGDRIWVELPAPEPLDLIPEDIDLAIIYEDENVVMVNKPAGMVVHPSAGHDQGTLVHAALAHAPFMSGIGGKMRPGIVHRLDKDTSGLILIAKNEPAHKWLQKQFKERRVEKKYLALVDGHPKTPSGRIIAPIMRDRFDRKKMAIAPEGEGRYAETEYHTLKAYKFHTYLEVHPLTGRTHQIRVHMASIGCPIAGDKVYGYRNPSIPLERHFLHAHQISICLLNERKPRTFQAELPEELISVLNSLFS